MKKEPQNFWTMLENTAAEMEEFWQDAFAAVETFTDEVTETMEVLVEQLQDAIVVEIDRYVEDFFEPLIEVDSELEDFIFEYLSEDDNFTDVSIVHPSQNNHAACIGCRHYHGQAYNGKLLVCGMHPYGWDDNTCPDWESN